MQYFWDFIILIVILCDFPILVAIFWDFEILVAIRVIILKYFDIGETMWIMSKDDDLRQKNECYAKEYNIGDSRVYSRVG